MGAFPPLESTPNPFGSFLGEGKTKTTGQKRNDCSTNPI